MSILDVLTEMALTGRWGPLFIGAELNDVTAEFGKPFEIGPTSRHRKWPRLLAYGDLELSVCGCRRVCLIHVQTWRDRIELPAGLGSMRLFAGGITPQDVTTALDRAGCPWQPDTSSTFGNQIALTVTPTGAAFVFEGPHDAEPVLNSVGLPGDFHECPPPSRGSPRR